VIAFHRGAEYLHGIELFNQEQFFECHEVLEEVWRPARGPERLFLQALIHFAVGFYHHQRANRLGTLLQLTKALRKLAGYLPEFGGMDTWKLYHDGLQALDQVRAGQALTPFPKVY